MSSIKAGILHVYGNTVNQFLSRPTDLKNPPPIPTVEQFASNYLAWEKYIEQLEEIKKKARLAKKKQALEAIPGYDPLGPQKDAQKEIALGRKLYQWERTNAKVAALQYCQTDLISMKPIKTHDDAIKMIKHHWENTGKSYGDNLDDAAMRGNTIATLMKSYGLVAE
jgi:hypothetical protein